MPTNSDSNTNKNKEMTKVVNMQSGPTVPQLFITKGKQRLKQYVDTVYLNNGDEFELELFNPTQKKLLAKIELNGSPIGNGIILRPGERVFLERYLDDPKKFKFETYDVDGSNQEVLDAIRKNGDVIVKFYEEINFTITPNTLVTGTSWTYTGGYHNITWTNNTDNAVIYTSSANSAFVNTSNIPVANTSSTETGRIEKGSNSNQTFNYDYSNFSNSASHAYWFKIKPQSTKLKTREDLTIYCTECGAKRKKDSFKFCPHCGTKF
jgi:hypothetical protein